jgi:hypothetical protein
MKKFPLLISFLVAFALFTFSTTNSPAKDLILTDAPVQIYFSPHGGCTEAIVAELNKARSEILVGRLFHIKTHSASPS